MSELDRDATVGHERRHRGVPCGIAGIGPAPNRKRHPVGRVQPITQVECDANLANRSHFRREHRPDRKTAAGKRGGIAGRQLDVQERGETDTHPLDTCEAEFRVQSDVAEALPVEPRAFRFVVDPRNADVVPEAIWTGT